MTTTSADPDRTIRRFPRSRKLIVDNGRAHEKRHPMVGLIEVDVTEARQLIRERKAATGEGLSFTAFVAACLARAVAEHPEVQAYRDLRHRLVAYRSVDVCLSAEVDVEGSSFPMSHVLRNADRRTVKDLHDEIRRLQRDPASSPSVRMIGPAKAFLVVPGPLRAWLWRSLRRWPRQQRELAGTVGVTAVGMFGPGGGWGIPFQVHSLNVVIGGIAERPAIVRGELVPREVLDVTLSFDHDVVDGAPAARFTARFRELLGSAYGLAEPVAAVAAIRVPTGA
jgi:pyruvate/2-oxoglutarate dehydrogenase complex dihydrolipoamide acyltransferase (E2) component